MEQKIKKAQDYVDTIRIQMSEGVEIGEIINTIVKTLHSEATLLAKLRRSSTDATMMSILKELDGKYRSVCRKAQTVLPYLNVDGFKNHLKGGGIDLDEDPNKLVGSKTAKNLRHHF
jgi:hypothetical protein